jgi:nucleotide-binding universal stress UspA family protein
MKLIAFVDGSSYSASVCDHVAWAARRLGASVEVFHMLGRRERPSAPADLSGNLRLGARSALLEDLARADEERARLTQARGRLILEEAQARLEAAGVAEVATRLRNDDIVRTVTEFETGAELVVIGKRGEGQSFALERLGSNLERILRSARGPVLAASRAFRPIERYVVAFDGGPSVMKALEHIGGSPLFAGLPGLLLQVGADTAEARARLEAAAAPLRAAGAAVETDIRPGEREEVIAAAVERDGNGLLVMGAYGHSRIRSLIIGSTTTAMARSSKTPLMMFR